MKMIVPRQYAPALENHQDLPVLTRDASARLDAGLDPSVVVTWITREGWPVDFAEWLVPCLIHDGVPDGIELEGVRMETFPSIEDPPLVPPVPDAATVRPGGRTILTGALPPVLPPAPAIAAPPVASPAPVPVTPAPLKLMDQPPSPLAEAFPEWSLLPPAALIKRIRRTL